MSSYCLTARELEVCELLIMGNTNREIATNLIISENTVEFHLRHIFMKLKVSSRTQAAVTYLQNRHLPASPNHKRSDSVRESR